MRCAVASLYHRAQYVLVSYAEGYPCRSHLCAKHLERKASEFSTDGVTHFRFPLQEGLREVKQLLSESDSAAVGDVGAHGPNSCATGTTKPTAADVSDACV